MRVPTVIMLFAAAPLLIAAALSFGPDPVRIEASGPLIHREGGYVGAASCAACHPDHHASWGATFHATMTQLPSPDVVRGRFDGREVRCRERTVRPIRRDGEFAMEIRGEAGVRTAEVVLAVGSHRYQQYFERQPRGDGDVLVRLPILWHVEWQRWLPLDTVFLEPDGERFEAHAAIWNENCILCHNTAPEPRLLNYRDPARARDGGRFDSRVAQLGIGCESCHGPGERHVAAMRDPLRRLAGRGGEPGIVDPLHLDKERAVAVCAQCHGARMPQPLQRIADWLTTGPTYRPGERLLDHVTPISATTPVRGSSAPDLFSARFWGDGTARLTAYEFQGVAASACYLKGELGCGSCHAMHTGDPRGQLRPDRPGNEICTQCHAAIGRDVAAHTHHRVDGAGSVCVDCHMPRIVYGITAVHRSHRIDSPDAARDLAAGRPHACTLCHVDRTPVWAGQQLRSLWGDRFAEVRTRRDGAPLDVADALAGLHAGDAAARAVWAAAFGRASATCAPSSAWALAANLAAAMGDGYPMVRLLAQRSLQAFAERRQIGLADRVAAVDQLGDDAARRAAIESLLASFAARPAAGPGSAVLLCGADGRLDLAAVLRLFDLQGRHVIAIGE